MRRGVTDHKGITEGVFWGDETVLYPDCHSGYDDLYMCKNS